MYYAPCSQVQDQYGQDLNDALAENDALKDQLQGLEKKLEVSVAACMYVRSSQFKPLHCEAERWRRSA